MWCNYLLPSQSYAQLITNSSPPHHTISPTHHQALPSSILDYSEPLHKFLIRFPDVIILPPSSFFLPSSPLLSYPGLSPLLLSTPTTSVLHLLRHSAFALCVVASPPRWVDPCLGRLRFRSPYCRGSTPHLRPIVSYS